MNTTNKFEIFGAAYGLAGRHPGPAQAPAMLRQLGLLARLQKLGLNVQDAGDLNSNAKDSGVLTDNLKNFSPTLDYLKQLYEKVLAIYHKGSLPLVLGGDHSVSIASIAAACTHLKTKIGASARLGVLWVDAHPDLNTEQSTVSGNIHGMSLGMLLGLGKSDLCNIGGIGPKVKAESLVYLGLRDVEPGEREMIRKLGIEAYSMTEIDMIGMGQACLNAISKIENNCDAFVVSFDLDACDPRYAPGVGTPQRGGLTYRESHLVMELVAQSKKLLTVELVEYNPELDIDGHTADLTIGLLESALGKSIL